MFHITQTDRQTVADVQGPIVGLADGFNLFSSGLKVNFNSDLTENELEVSMSEPLLTIVLSSRVLFIYCMSDIKHII